MNKMTKKHQDISSKENLEEIFLYLSIRGQFSTIHLGCSLLYHPEMTWNKLINKSDISEYNPDISIFGPSDEYFSVNKNEPIGKSKIGQYHLFFPSTEDINFLYKMRSKITKEE